jgi:hypothetical protein
MKVKLDLVGLDGNAHSLMGAFRKAARQPKADPAWVTSVLEDCMSGDYNHLLTVLMDATEPVEENEEYEFE